METGLAFIFFFKINNKQFSLLMILKNKNSTEKEKEKTKKFHNTVFYKRNKKKEIKSYKKNRKSTIK